MSEKANSSEQCIIKIGWDPQISLEIVVILHYFTNEKPQNIYQKKHFGVNSCQEFLYIFVYPI